MTRTMLEAATASTVPTTRWGVNLQRYMRHATSYECMVKDVQRAQRNARAPVPPIPGNANPTAAEGIDFTLLPDTEAGPQLAGVVELKHEELSVLGGQGAIRLSRRGAKKRYVYGTRLARA